MTEARGMMEREREREGDVGKQTMGDNRWGHRYDTERERGGEIALERERGEVKGEWRADLCR